MDGDWRGERGWKGIGGVIGDGRGLETKCLNPCLSHMIAGSESVIQLHIHTDPDNKLHITSRK